MEALFDLNIEQVLEHWGPEHALREIIANALDEQILTNSPSIKVYKENNEWHIRDYGRGLQYIHFTQNENQEKMSSPYLIGKFGVGLKDALAVFYRKNINVKIESKYAHITLVMAYKSGFDLETLHAAFGNPQNTNMQGTDFIISGISDEDVEKAKSMFLYFNKNADLLEKTRYGEVYKSEAESSIYINGVKVATESNFLFSYNITNINAQIKKALNRERSNVGRSVYSDTIKNILQQCKSDKVLLPLVEDLKNVMRGTNCDESTWVDVAAYAARTLNTNNNVVFMTPETRSNLTNQQIELLEESGKKLIMVTDNVFSKINDSVTVFEDIVSDYINSFEYKFIAYDDLTLEEKIVFDKKEFLINFLKKYNYKYDADIAISETICMDSYGRETMGIRDGKNIIIKRKVLSSLHTFLGILIHEFAHYHSGYEDNTREFENILTEMLGKILYELQMKSDQKI